jgi:thioredoxin-related protein
MNMSKLALAAVCVFIGSASVVAQPDKPVHPATPAFVPTQPKEQPKAEKPKLYDEEADARQQIAAAVAKAKKENRRVLLQWGGNWCGWCIKLHEVCQNDAKIKQKLQYEYDVVHVDAGRDKKNMDLAKSYDAEIDGFPFLTILDSSGKVVVNQSTPPFEVDGKSLAAGHDTKKVLEFLTKHQAPYLDAQQILDEGLSEAKRSGKRVFLHFGGPSCGWCHKLEGWMAKPEIATIISKDFVDVKIDIERTIDGEKVMGKFTKTKGISWIAFLDDSGAIVADSGGPDTNLGFPYSKEEVAGFVEMLKKAAVKISPADINTLAASLNANREADEKKKAQKDH